MIAKLVIKRLIAALPNLLGVLVVTFLLTRALPGDPAAYLAGPAASTEAVEQIREELGFNKSLPEQFVIYMKDITHGDWGTSWATGNTVVHEILTRLPASVELTLLALVFALAVALPMGVAAATRPGTWIDHLTRTICTAGVSLPTFFTGLALVYVFYYLLDWFPAPMGRLPLFAMEPEHVTGFFLVDSLLAGDTGTFVEAVRHIFLPALTLGLFALAPIARMTRASMLSTLSTDYVRTAKAYSMPAWKVLYVYAFRNALLVIVTTLGMVFSFLLGANVLVEKVFSWPGIGSFALESLVISDYASVQGFVLSMGTLYVVVNLLIDIAYGIIDPRIRIDS